MASRGENRYAASTHGNKVEATLSNATSRTILSTKSNVASTKVERCFHIVAVFSNNVEQILRPFDKVEQIKHAQFSMTMLNDQATNCC